MSTPLTRSQARMWTIGAQAGALVCVLGVVALGMIGLPEHSTGVAIEQARNNALPYTTKSKAKPSPGGQIAGADQSIDIEGVADRLALVSNAPKAPVIVEIDPETKPEPPKGPTEGERNMILRVKYIGFINDARTQHAFVRIDGKQRIVGVGDLINASDGDLPDIAVVRITPDYVRLRDTESDDTAEVRLASKSGPSITMVGGDDVAVAQKPSTDNNGSLLTPEEEALIESLPPRQRQPARRRMEREKRGLSPENEFRRPTPEALVKIRGGAAGGQTNVQRRNNQRNNNE